MELIDRVGSNKRVDSRVGKGLLIAEAVLYVLLHSSFRITQNYCLRRLPLIPLCMLFFYRCILLLVTSLSAPSVPYLYAYISVTLSANKSRQGYLLASLNYLVRE